MTHPLRSMRFTAAARNDFGYGNRKIKKNFFNFTLGIQHIASYDCFGMM